MVRPQTSRRHARRILLLLGGGAGAYALYRWYVYENSRRKGCIDGQHASTMPAQLSTWSRLKSAARTYGDSFVALSELVGALTSDLKEYLEEGAQGSSRTAAQPPSSSSGGADSADSTHQRRLPRPLPPRLVQLLQLASSPDVCEALRKLTAAAREGVLPSSSLPFAAAAAAGSGPGNSSEDAAESANAAGASRRQHTAQVQEALAEQIVGALASQRGQTLVSLVVGVATRNAVATVCDHLAPRAAASASQPSNLPPIGQVEHEPGQPQQRRRLGPPTGASPNSALQAFFDVLATPNGRSVMVTALSVLMTRAVHTWLTDTADVDAWGQMFAAASRPENRATVERVTGLMTHTAICSAMSYASPAASPARPPLVRVGRAATARSLVLQPHTYHPDASHQHEAGPQAMADTLTSEHHYSDDDVELEQLGGDDVQAFRASVPAVGTAPGAAAGGPGTSLPSSDNESESLCSGSAWEPEGSPLPPASADGPDAGPGLVHSPIRKAAAAGLAAAVTAGAGCVGVAADAAGGAVQQGQAGGVLQSALEGGTLVGAAAAEVLRKAASDAASRSLVLALAATCMWQAAQATVFSLFSLVSPARAAAAAAALSSADRRASSTGAVSSCNRKSDVAAGAEAAAAGAGTLASWAAAAWAAAFAVLSSWSLATAGARRVLVRLYLPLALALLAMLTLALACALQRWAAPVSQYVQERGAAVLDWAQQQQQAQVEV